MREPDMDTLVFFSGHPDALELYRVFEDPSGDRETLRVHRRAEDAETLFLTTGKFLRVFPLRTNGEEEGGAAGKWVPGHAPSALPVPPCWSWTDGSR